MIRGGRLVEPPGFLEQMPVDQRGGGSVLAGGGGDGRMRGSLPVFVEQTARLAAVLEGFPEPVQRDALDRVGGEHRLVAFGEARGAFVPGDAGRRRSSRRDALRRQPDGGCQQRDASGEGDDQRDSSGGHEAASLRYAAASGKGYPHFERDATR